MGFAENLAGFRVQIKRFAGAYRGPADRTAVVVSEEVLPRRAARLQSVRLDGDARESLAYLRPVRSVGLLEAYRSHG